MTTLNKHFANFLKTKKKGYWECDHDENHWCQNCIAKPKMVEQKLPDGRVSKGFLFTNQ